MAVQREHGDAGDYGFCRKFQIPPDLVVKSQGIDTVDVMCSGYDDYTSWTNGKSRREQPSPSEALRLPRNPGECEIFKATVLSLGSDPRGDIVDLDEDAFPLPVGMRNAAE